MNIDILVGLLSPHFRTVAARDGRQALNRLKMPPLPDLILLDVMMPIMDGYEVCRQLRAEKETRHLPIIFISALEDIEDKLRAFSAGGVDYITKPFQAEEVRARVKTHLALRSLQKRLEEKNSQLPTGAQRDKNASGSSSHLLFL